MTDYPNSGYSRYSLKDKVYTAAELDAYRENIARNERIINKREAKEAKVNTYTAYLAHVNCNWDRATGWTKCGYCCAKTVPCCYCVCCAMFETDKDSQHFVDIRNKWKSATCCTKMGYCCSKYICWVCCFHCPCNSYSPSPAKEKAKAPPEQQMETSAKSVVTAAVSPSMEHTGAVIFWMDDTPVPKEQTVLA
ncbi:Hypothetical protein POVN_LOCUS203 [uncultured virus]|nr:Hypothetical protein POVN_LOCUS203 [uncultured virus]